MHEGGELNLAGGPFSGLVAEILGKGSAVRLRAKGGSMAPFIKDGDVIVIAPLGGKAPRIGDVAAFVHPGLYRLAVHRIVAGTAEGFVMRGDNCGEPDGEVVAAAVLGRVASIERNGRMLRMGGSLKRRVLARLSKAGVLRQLVALARHGLGRDEKKREG